MSVLELDATHTVCAGCGRHVQVKRTYPNPTPEWPAWLPVLRYCARRCAWRASSFDWQFGREA